MIELSGKNKKMANDADAERRRKMVNEDGGLNLEWYESEALTPKISVVMQSYLGEYPGSRSNPELKLFRAVQTFLFQKYKNCELIIVADGCYKTQQIYNQFFKDEPTVKLIYVGRDTGDRSLKEPVAGSDTLHHFRGYPRQVGVEAATGDLITYMDSDDIILPEHTLNIQLNYNKYPDKKWFIQKSWYDNEVGDQGIMSQLNVAPEDPITIIGVEGKWCKVNLTDDGKHLNVPWLLSHVAGLDVKWRDVIAVHGQGEDADFNTQLKTKYDGQGLCIEHEASYVRCHSDYWDL